MAQWRKVLVSGSAAVLTSVTSDAAITAGTSFVIGSADINETDFEKIDGITDGAGAANKALVLDGNADIASGLRNITLTGTIGSGNITSTGTVQGTTITATTAFIPDASDGAALGTTTREFSDLFLADGAVFALGDGGGDVTFTHVADTGVLLNSTNKIQFNDSSQYIGASSAADLDIAATTDVNIDATTLDVNAALDVSGATTLNGAVTLGDATGDDITNTGRWVGDFVPKSDSAIDLGTSTLQFAEAHIDTGYIDAITVTGTSTLTTVDINGGAIDGTTIGAASAAAGTFAAIVGTTLSNASLVGASHLTGSFTGSFVGDGSNLTGVSQDIDTLNAYGAATLHQTQDKLLVSDNGTEKSITFSNLQDSIFADVSGDAGIAAGGDLSLTVAAITNQTNMTGDVADADELIINDGGSLKRVDFSVFRDAVFNDVSGDASIADGGALTIAATSVENSMLADDAVDSDEIASGAVDNDHMAANSIDSAQYVDASIDTAHIGNQQITNALMADAAIGADELAANAVVNASVAAGAAIDIDKLSWTSEGITLTDFAQDDKVFLYDTSGTAIAGITTSNFEDAIFGNVSGEATIAGGGALTLGATNTSLTTLANLTTAGALNAGSITTGFGAINNGASGITTSGTVAAGTLTVSANATIEGDLTVNGTTTTLATTNLAVGDAFIFAATGSAASNVDAGLIVQEGASVDSGSAIYHDTGDNRWSVAKSVAASATAVTALEHVVTVKQLGDNDDPVSADKEYGAGEMAINTDGTIWIFS